MRIIIMDNEIVVVVVALKNGKEGDVDGSPSSSNDYR